MANNIQILKQTELLGRQFAVFGTPEEPLFLAKDVATWIEHTDVSKMVQSVDDDEKLTRTMFVSGQNREVWVLTENGLYEVLMLSRKPIAKEFKKGVKKILHDIRTTGRYEAKTLTPAQQLLANAQMLVEIEQRQMEQERQQKLLDARQEIAENRIEQIETRIRDNGYMAVVGFANIYKVKFSDAMKKKLGKLASSWCHRMGVLPEKIKHERWGFVNTYPMQALRDVFKATFPDKSAMFDVPTYWG